MSDPEKTLELMRRIKAKEGVTTAVTEAVRDDFKQQTGHDLGDVVEVRPNLPKDKPEGWDQMILACIRYNPLEPLSLPDNEKCLCAWGCGQMVQYRPKHPEWLTKVCLECIAERPVENNS